MKKQEIPVMGMSCAACALSVEKTLQKQAGVKSVQVNYANHAAWVEWEEDKVSLESLRDSVDEAGYELLIDDILREDLEKMHQNAFEQLKKNTIMAGVLAFPVFVIGMFGMHWPFANWIMWLLTTPILLVFGRQFFTHAYKLARVRQVNMDTLVALSTGIAYVYSTFNTFYPTFLNSRGLDAHVYFEAAAVIIFFILLGKTMEASAKAGTGQAIRQLMDLQPKMVTLVKDGKEMECSIEEVQKGDFIRIKPGQTIPVDGVVTNGSSYVDQSMLTGEPVPVLRNINDQVFAGTINQQGSFIFESTAVGKSTLLATIIESVKNAQASKAPVQKLVDKVASIFVPTVMGIALLSFLIWGFSGVDDSWLRGMLAFITVLVIACPCALGLATPTAITAAMGKAAQLGILIKDAETLEKGTQIDTLVLDKTGTITEGKPHVAGSWWAKEASKQDKQAIYTLETYSEHPLAIALVEHLQEMESIPLNSFDSITGKGLIGKTNDHTYKIGNQAWGGGESKSITGAIQNLEQTYPTASLIYASKDEQVIACFAIQDRIKSTSKVAIEAMQASGLEVHMLTGDQANTAQAVGEEVGILYIQSGVLPHEKGEYIKQLKSKGKKVAMVGDGINDSEALSLADVSIAMGKGSDLAKEVAAITLIHGDLSSIPTALQLTKKTVRIIRQNLFWAFIYNIIGIPVAAGLLYPFFGFLLNPMLAGAAMALSSVSVVTNSLRIRGIG
ncbi:copper-translocating P-type ATPase [Mongoliitalea daihaiensis]|nr:copper-translocating P-type ATPase [Mongoliitalea daihaiensis]